MIVGRRFVWSVHVVELTPFGAIPGPTIPTHVLPISCWMSPWFHAKPGLTHGLLPHDGPVAPAVKKKSSFPNIVNVGVRFGSVLTMCSVASSTGSAKLTATGTD